MFGTSLFGAEYAAADVDMTIIFRNLLLGMAVGVLFSFMSRKGVYGEWRDHMNRKQEEEIRQLEEEGSYGKAWLKQAGFLEKLPWVGKKMKKWLTPKKVDETISAERKLDDMIARLYDLYDKEYRRRPRRPAELNRILSMIQALEAKRAEKLLAEAREIDEIKQEAGVPEKHTFAAPHNEMPPASPPPEV